MARVERVAQRFQQGTVSVPEPALAGRLTVFLIAPLLGDRERARQTRIRCVEAPDHRAHVMPLALGEIARERFHALVVRERRRTRHHSRNDLERVFTLAQLAVFEAKGTLADGNARLAGGRDEPRAHVGHTVDELGAKLDGYVESRYGQSVDASTDAFARLHDDRARAGFRCDARGR